LAQTQRGTLMSTPLWLPMRRAAIADIALPSSSPAIDRSPGQQVVLETSRAAIRLKNSSAMSAGGKAPSVRLQSLTDNVISFVVELLCAVATVGPKRRESIAGLFQEYALASVIRFRPESAPISDGRPMGFWADHSKHRRTEPNR